MAIVKSNKTFFAMFFGLISGFIVLQVKDIVAAPVNLPLSGAMNTSRPCSHKGLAKSDVTSASSTSNRSAAMTANTQVYVTCDVDSQMVQGSSGVTGSATNGVVLWDHTPYWFMAESSGEYFAFTKKSGEADGTCYVVECR
jgi:hypothetical protein